MELLSRFTPEVPSPEPGAGTQEADGWSSVRRLGGWKAILCQFPMLEECPCQHEEVWVWAWGEVLRRFELASSEEEINTALMWVMFLAQGLLRKPTRGGRGKAGRAGRGQVAKRFAALQRGDWGYLVDQWEKEYNARQQRGERVRRQETAEEERARLGKEAAALIGKGHISKAMKRLTSNGVASAESRDVIAQLKAKYPERLRQLPNRVVKADPVPSLSGLRDSLTNLKDGISPGCGGLRQEYLSLLGRQLGDEGMRRMEEFGMRYLRGDLPPWFFCCWLTVQCVPIFKSAARDTLRPLGLRNPLLKSFHKYVSRANRQVVKDFVEPQQMVLTEGGGCKLVFSVRGMVELIKPGTMYEDWVVVKIDIKNAYNETCRAETVKIMQSEESLEHLACYTAATLAPHSGLECGGKLIGTTGEGGTQGDSRTTDDFVITLQPSLVRLDTACKQEGGQASGGADDCFAFAPRQAAMAAVKSFSGEVKERTGLEVQWGKTEVYALGEELPDGAPDGMTRAGRMINGEFVRGFMCWGVPVGEDLYVTTVLEEKVAQILDDGKKSLDVLGPEHRHAAWIALKQSIWPRFDYWAQTCYPSNSLPAARRLDAGLHRLLEQVVGIRIPLGANDDMSTLLLPTPLTGSRRNMSFQAWVLRQPVKCGGAGLRTFEEICRPAFAGACELALPSLHTGFCSLLTDIVGGGDRFGDDWEGRWRTLFSSNCRAGQELKLAWMMMQVETRRAMQFLGEEDEEVLGPLAAPPESAGEGSTTGATRKKLVEAREILMGKVLLRALEQAPNQQQRGVWSWPERDKLTAQWLLCLPGFDSTLSAAEFSEAFATLLCLDSPSCCDPLLLGERVGRRVVDRYGDNVVSQTLAGNGYRKRHDGVKQKMLGLMRWAGLDVECEVFNVFARYIPQQGLSRLERGRKRQGMVPDFALRLPAELAQVIGVGGNSAVLAELKVLSSCPTRYRRAPRAAVKAVTKRAGELPGEYARKARTMDVEYGGVPEGEVGPVARKLSSFPPLQGWVFGAWNEASPDVHNLVHLLAKARLKKEDELQEWGVVARRKRVSEEAALAALTGQVRRQLSLVSARAQARLLLDRVAVLGQGTVAAAGRRRWVEEEERRMRREQRAHLLALEQGRAVLRRGDIFLQ